MTGERTESAEEERAPLRPVAYCDFGKGEQDLLMALLPSMGIQPRPCDLEEVAAADSLTVVNCLSVASKRIVGQQFGDHTLIVTDLQKRENFTSVARVLALPDSYARLKSALEQRFDSSDVDQPKGHGSWVTRMRSKSLSNRR